MAALTAHKASITDSGSYRFRGFLSKMREPKSATVYSASPELDGMEAEGPHKRQLERDWNAPYSECPYDHREALTVVSGGGCS